MSEAGDSPELWPGPHPHTQHLTQAEPCSPWSCGDIGMLVLCLSLFHPKLPERSNLSPAVLYCRLGGRNGQGVMAWGTARFEVPRDLDDGSGPLAHNRKQHPPPPAPQ